MALKVMKTVEGTAVVDANLLAKEYEILYLVTGAKNRNEAFKAVYEDAPDKVDSLVKSGCRFEKFNGDSMEVTVLYEKPEDDASGTAGTTSGLVGTNISVSFDSTGGSEHIVQAREDALICGSEEGAKTSPKPGKMIGWDGISNQYNGVDIVIPYPRKTVVRRYSNISTSFENLVIDMTGTINSDKFMGRDPGEVLFLGATWTDDHSGPFDASFFFAIKPNETGTVQGKKYTKKGWEYIWRITKTMAKENQPPEIKILGEYISRVYRETDFKKLGLHV